MNKIVHLSVTKKDVPIRIDVVQYATKPAIVFVLDDYMPEEGATASIFIKKPDGTEVFNACVLAENTITFHPTTQSFASLGTNKCQLQVVESGDTALSFIIYADVTENIIDSSAIESQNEFTALEQALQNVSRYDGEIEELQDRATALEGNISSVESDISALEGRASTIEGDIETLDGKTTSLESSVSDINDALTEVDKELDKKMDVPELIGNEQVGYVDAWLGWSIAKQGDIMNMAIVNTQILENRETSPDETAYHVTKVASKVLPMPIDELSGSVVADSVIASSCQMWTDKNCVLRFRMGGLGAIAGDRLLRFSLMGIRRKPPTHVAHSLPTEQREQIIANCKTYTDRALSGERRFAYGKNWSYNTTYNLNDSSGKGLFECDTFVFMNVMGIPYEQSPYVNTAPNASYNYNNLVFNPNNYEWAKNWNVADDVSRYRSVVTWTELWWLWYNECVFSDIDSVQSGDIVIFRDPPRAHTRSGYGMRSFDNIGHIGIAEVVNGEIFIFHCSGSYETDGLILARQPLSTVLERSRYDIEDIYFARLKTS